MSNIERVENLKQIVVKQETDFKKLASIHNAVHFEREKSFAIQILQDNSYLAEVAFKNSDSLVRAVLNVAAVGLSLSPVHKLAYLVPRDNKVCLDISYRGYVHLAIEAGCILWAIAEIVCEKDSYVFSGVNAMPIHKYEPFGDRGKIVGAYCVAKLPSGEYMTTNMALPEIYSIRDRSASFKNSKGGPWRTDETEMIKKTVIKRGAKSWPNTTKSDRFTKAQEVLEETDEMIFDTTATVIDDGAERTEKLSKIREGLSFLSKDEEAFVKNNRARTFKRELKALEDLTDIELDQTVAFIEQQIQKKKELDNDVA